jgi:hypothetical protein
MLRVTNAAAERLIALIPNIQITEVKELVELANLANSVADSSIKLRQALTVVRENTIKAIGGDGKVMDGELLPPPRSEVGGLNAALAAFRKVN